VVNAPLLQPTLTTINRGGLEAKKVTKMIFPKKTHIKIKSSGTPLFACLFPALSYILRPLPWHDKRLSPTLRIWEQEARVAQELMSVFVLLKGSPVFCLTLSTGLVHPRGLMHHT